MELVDGKLTSQHPVQEMVWEMVWEIFWEIIRNRVEGKNLFNKGLIGGNLAFGMG